MGPETCTDYVIEGHLYVANAWLLHDHRSPLCHLLCPLWHWSADQSAYWFRDNLELVYCMNDWGFMHQHRISSRNTYDNHISTFVSVLSMLSVNQRVTRLVVGLSEMATDYAL